MAVRTIAISRTRFVVRLLFILSLTAFVATDAAPPHPKLVQETASGKAARPFFMNHMDELRAAGINSGTNVFEKELSTAKSTATTSSAVLGEFNILAILVQFSDNTAATSANYYDDILYDISNISVRHYYRDASFGQLDIVTVNMPSSQAWRVAPQNYAYYVNGESGVNPDSYPNNAQKLVEELVVMVDPVIDFSNYDNDDNGFVDVLMVIHAGRGAELTGSNDDMWSHQWSIYPHSTGDGVYVSNYTMQPEYLFSPGDMTIGVFVHELGHAFGLPDLYDTDYSSNGIGSWGIMAYGSWLGPQGNGGIPAHPSAWSRIQMGFTTPEVVSVNTSQQAIADVKNSGDIYRLWNAGSVGNEYFLVENRQRAGYDAFLPASGLLVWHIDESMASNDNEWYPGLSPSSHYLVAVEQSDGLYDMEHSADMGDANDVFPNGGDAFNAVSLPNSDGYSSGASMVAVENITVPGAIMYADFRVGIAGSIGDDSDDSDDATGGDVLPERLTLRQNYPNPFNPSTTIPFYSPEAGYARVNVINTLGYVVKSLYDGAVAEGVTELVWDGTNNGGSGVASGIYLYQVDVNGQKQVKKMVLVR